MERLKKHLRQLQRRYPVVLWSDRDIAAGDLWEGEIEGHLDTAHFILLLISPDFMESPYCYGKEMKKAMQRHEQGEACVIPVILHPVIWHDTPFGRLQALPEDGHAVMSEYWKYADGSLFNITKGI